MNNFCLESDYCRCYLAIGLALYTQQKFLPALSAYAKSISYEANDRNKNGYDSARELLGDYRHPYIDEGRVVHL